MEVGFNCRNLNSFSKNPLDESTVKVFQGCSQLFMKIQIENKPNSSRVDFMYPSATCLHPCVGLYYEIFRKFAASQNAGPQIF